MAAQLQSPLPTTNGLIEPVDISNAILYLVGESGRYVTGITMRVDAGFGSRV
jgi:NAD(P)-dependent dehydrogenase (short-subunit alcohol dehydrogenase family)